MVRLDKALQTVDALGKQLAEARVQIADLRKKLENCTCGAAEESTEEPRSKLEVKRTRFQKED